MLTRPQGRHFAQTPHEGDALARPRTTRARGPLPRGRHFAAAPRHLAPAAPGTPARIRTTAAGLALAGSLAALLSACGTDKAPSALGGVSLEATTASYDQVAVPTLRETSYATVTFSAVGDNLLHMPVVNEADANAGTMGDGLYDFSPMYAGVQDIVSSRDLNFIDQETILGGDYLGFSGYPSFNSPSAVASQVSSYGWNLVTTATNHSWDMGLEGVLNSCAAWEVYPNVAETGTFESWEDRNSVRVIESHGIRFAFLSYTDSLNGYTLPEDATYAVATVDPDLMAADIARAKQVSDVVIVAMSWGEENATSPNDSQRWYAQFLADQGVDLVVGFGPHVIQPIEWFYGQASAGENAGSETLVVFSLGNFLSNQPLAIENVEGCFTCTFERYGDSGDVKITDLCWTPLINHVSADSSWHQVFKLKDYTYDLAYAHQSLGLEADPIAYARDLTQSIIGPSGIYIDM